jgi:hypothetical protein
MLLKKSGSAGNRTRDLWVCSQEVWPQGLKIWFLGHTARGQSLYRMGCTGQGRGVEVRHCTEMTDELHDSAAITGARMRFPVHTELQECANQKARRQRQMPNASAGSPATDQNKEGMWTSRLIWKQTSGPIFLVTGSLIQNCVSVFATVRASGRYHLAKAT